MLADIPNCHVYLDYVVLFSSCWSEHLKTILLSVTVKCEFKSDISWQSDWLWTSAPIDCKGRSNSRLPRTPHQTWACRFLGLDGYYRCFGRNFSVAVAPLPQRCSPKEPFVSTNDCQHDFDCATALLCSGPDFTGPFKIEADASATGAGAVFLQDGPDNISHPVSCASVKFKCHRLNYSTIKKEILQHFDVYVQWRAATVVVYTDHNSLVFLDRNIPRT